MIAEFALTPAVFDPAAHDDRAVWVEQLNELKHGIFPRTAVSPVLISNLAGGWLAWVEHLVKNIKDEDQQVRIRVQELLTKVTDRLVRRAKRTNGNLTDEGGWVNEATSWQADEPIDRVIASGPYCDVIADRPKSVRSIRDVTGELFWEGITSAWSPAARFTDQVRSIRKVCVHSEFLWLVSPHIEGKEDDETEFTVHFVREAFRRTEMFPLQEVEVHTEGPRVHFSLQSVEYQEILGRLRDDITADLRPVVPQGRALRVVFWKRLLERGLLAGYFTPTSAGPRHAPRFCVYMGHVARRADQRTNDRHHWHLLHDADIGEWYRKLSNRRNPTFIDSVTITGV